MPDPSAIQPSSFPALDALFNNPVFAGGAGLAGIAATAAFTRRLTIQGAGLIKRRLLINVELSKQDPSFKWVLQWLSFRASQHPATGFIEKRLTRINDMSMQTRVNTDTSVPSQFLLEPGFGRHIMHYKNAYISVRREKQTSGSHDGKEPHETLTMTTLYAYRHIFQDIFGEVHKLALMASEGKTIIYKVSSFGWDKFGDPRRKRPLESVILDEGIRERITGDVKEFLDKQQWYTDRGIPYRRGYLLYGPPGSGKTSFIQALAGELDFNIAIVNLAERGMTDDRLSLLITKLPAKTILLLEDADAAFNNRNQVNAEGYSGATVTFSGLLNALDGVAAGEERVAFLTTNHIDRLDAALIRPGRVDMIERIGEATRYQAAEMWDRFYGDIDENGAYKERFLQRMEDLELFGRLKTSTAAIQGLFVFNKDDMEGAIKQAEGLIPRVYEPEQHEAMRVPA